MSSTAQAAGLRPRILIVDDELPNRRLLVAMLDAEGFDCVEAASGAVALQLAAEQSIDLVLLDVMMPGLSGFEVCRRMRADPRLGQLPIIFVTALGDRASRIAGKAAGGDDFLGKPIDEVELLVRVRSLLALRAQANRLVALDRFKDEMTALLAHDLRNVLAVMTNTVGWAQEQTGLDVAVSEALADARSAGEKGVRLLGNLLDVSRLEEGALELEREQLELGALLNGIVAARQGKLRQRSITLTCNLATVTAAVDTGLLTRVLDNLLDNALRYLRDRGRLHVGLEQSAGLVRITVSNDGPAIPPDLRERIFEKRVRAAGAPGHTEDRQSRHGLGLYFCQLALSAHGGRIWVESSADWPTSFVLQLPVAQAA